MFGTCDKPVSITVKLKRLREELEQEYVKQKKGQAQNLTINGEIKADLEAIQSLISMLGIGDVSQLSTNDKTIVGAINEVATATDTRSIKVSNLAGENIFNAHPKT